MGVNWSIELISWALEYYTNAPLWTFYATDFLNATYGVLIFILFVCNKKTLNKLQKRCV